LARFERWRSAPPRLTALLETIAIELHGQRPGAAAGSREDDRDRRAEDVATLLALAGRWEVETPGGLAEFLDAVVLTDEDPGTSGTVDVLGLTLHAAKGLEFDTVVIVGAEDGLIPHYRHTAAETLAEERRLCYVGMTRARQHLIFSVARMRRLWGDVAFRPPSRFLREAGLAVAPVSPRGAGTPAEVSPS
jgi:superfamily I DNA/RNA helicase